MILKPENMSIYTEEELNHIQEVIKAAEDGRKITYQGEPALQLVGTGEYALNNLYVWPLDYQIES